MNYPLTVFVVDDNPRIRTALRRLLQSCNHVVQTCGSAEEFLAHYDPAQPGCIICDIALPGMDGFALHRHLKERGCAHPFIFLTGRGSIPKSVEALKNGAEHFFTKPVKDAELMGAVKTALDRDSTTRNRRAQLDSLTEREVEVLDRVVAGRMNKEIAADLGLSVRTIKFHRRNLSRKLDLNSAATLAQFAIETGVSARKKNGGESSAGDPPSRGRSHPKP